jgi:predicted dehydrogenase
VESGASRPEDKPTASAASQSMGLSPPWTNPAAMIRAAPARAEGALRRIAASAEDQVAVSGLLEGGAALSIHYRGGSSRGTNLLWEITNGTEGDLQLTATGGQAQIWEMDVRGGKGAQSPLEILPVPEQYRWAPPQGPGTNVAQAYARFARDYREGTHFCPTFEDAVTRHRMLDAIETARRPVSVKRSVDP